MKNAIDAMVLVKNPKISISSFHDKQNKLRILVSDNGKGIKDEIKDEIFTPFFSTKDKGSGIGLSLSRKIMLLHGGNISVKSEPGIGALFTLQF